MYIVYETQKCGANFIIKDHTFINYLISVFSIRVALDSST